MTYQLSVSVLPGNSNSYHCSFSASVKQCCILELSLIPCTVSYSCTLFVDPVGNSNLRRQRFAAAGPGWHCAGFCRVTELASVSQDVWSLHVVSLLPLGLVLESGSNGWGSAWCPRKVTLFHLPLGKGGTPFLYLFNRYSLSPCCVACPAPSARDTEVNRAAEVLALVEHIVWWGETGNKHKWHPQIPVSAVKKLKQYVEAGSDHRKTRWPGEVVVREEHLRRWHLSCYLKGRMK